MSATKLIESYKIDHNKITKIYEQKKAPIRYFLIKLNSHRGRNMAPGIDKNKFKFGKRLFRIVPIYPNLESLK